MKHSFGFFSTLRFSQYGMTDIDDGICCDDPATRMSISYVQGFCFSQSENMFSRGFSPNIIFFDPARNDIKIEAHLSQQFIPARGLRGKDESALHFLKTKGNPKACQECYYLEILGNSDA
jgi:hypothetical protein